MSKHLKRVFTALALSSLLLVSAAPAAAQVLPRDVVTVGSVTASPGTTVDVPVYIRDVSGTPLGMDQPPGSRIQAFSIKVDYSPAAPVQSVTFTRAGITAGLTPTSQFTPTAPGSASLIVSFQESTNPIPFTLNAAAPGNLVGRLTVTLSPSATPGSVVTLTLDPALTQLSNQGGTTSETVALGNLQLVNGTITITAAQAAVPVPAVGEWGLILLAIAVVFVAIRRI